MTDSALTIKHLNVAYGATQVVQSLDLAVSQGDFLCLLGPSGCGKTTVLKAIAGLIEPRTGEISLFDQTLFDSYQSHTSIPPEQRGIGFVFQDYALFPHLSVLDNLQFGVRHLNQQERKKRTEEYLSLLKITDIKDRYPHQLSGGQQQRVAVARALMVHPKLLLMDEPFSNIDYQTKHQLIGELRSLLKQQGVTTICVTHSQEEAFSFADQVAIMHGGHLQQVAPPDELYSHPHNAWVATFLNAGNLWPCGQTQWPIANLPSRQAPSRSAYLFQKNRFSIEKSHDTNGITLEQTRFLSSGYRHTLNVMGHVWQIDTLDKPEINIGDNVTLHYLAEPWAVACE